MKGVCACGSVRARVWGWRCWRDVVCAGVCARRKSKRMEQLIHRSNGVAEEDIGIFSVDETMQETSAFGN